MQILQKNILNKYIESLDLSLVQGYMVYGLYGLLVDEISIIDIEQHK